jgi:hypothetical protein
MENEVTVINQDATAMVAQERAQIDSQIATAKAYPRNLIKVKDNCIAIVSMDKETAADCRYVKPIGNNKTTAGPSVHLARILAQQYGNIRIQQRIKEIGQREIIAEAVAFDLETNYAVSVEARKSIIDRSGKRYKDAIITTNAMAVLAIAERNAILKVIPKSIIDKAYKAAFNTAQGDLSSEQKVLKVRKEMFDWLNKKYGAKEKDVLFALGLKSVTQVDAEQIATLRGLYQSLKDKEITPEELFGWEKQGEEVPNPLADKVKKPQPKKPVKPEKPEKSDEQIRDEILEEEKQAEEKKTKAQLAFEKSQRVYENPYRGVAGN